MRKAKEGDRLVVVQCSCKGPNRRAILESEATGRANCPECHHRGKAITYLTLGPGGEMPGTLPAYLAGNGKPALVQPPELHLFLPDA